MTTSRPPSRRPALTSFGLLVGLEARQRGDVDREAGVALGERRQVLVDQQGRRHEHGDLLAVLHRLEGGAHRDLGLAVADVAADDAVHRDGLLHVRLDLVDRTELVGRLVVGEGVLELALPRGVGAEGEAGRRRAGGVEPDQLGRDLLDRLAGPALGLLPVGAAEAVQGRLLAADVAGDLVELVGRDEEPVAGLAALGGGVLDDEVLAGGVLHGALHHLDVAADAVLLVDDEVAGLELQRVHRVAPAAGHPAHAAGRRPGLPEQVGLGEDHQAHRLARRSRGRGRRTRRARPRRRARRRATRRAGPARPRRRAPRRCAAPSRGPR